MTAPAPDRRCGTCVFWERESDPELPIDGRTWGDCMWSKAHMPASMRYSDLMRDTDGTDCSQWSDGAEALGEGGR